jgi:hypothetical protein
MSNHLLAIFDFESDQLLGWIAVLDQQYRDQQINDIAVAEGVQILTEAIEGSYETMAVEHTFVVILNSFSSPEDQ